MQGRGQSFKKTNRVYKGWNVRILLTWIFSPNENLFILVEELRIVCHEMGCDLREVVSCPDWNEVLIMDCKGSQNLEGRRMIVKSCLYEIEAVLWSLTVLGPEDNSSSELLLWKRCHSPERKLFIFIWMIFLPKIHYKSLLCSESSWCWDLLQWICVAQSRWNSTLRKKCWSNFTKLFSCEDAAQEVLMYVCPTVWVLNWNSFTVCKSIKFQNIAECSRIECRI